MADCSRTFAAAIHHHPLHLKLARTHHRLLKPNNGSRRSMIRCCGTSRARAKENYYQVLGVNIHSTPQEIKEAYRKLQKQHHPDIAGYKGHEYSSLLNEAYSTLMREDFRSSGKIRRGEFQSGYSGNGYGSWNGPVRGQALFVDENKCVGCRECVHHAGETFVMDEALGSAHVKVQFGDHEQQIEVAVESCPVNCIHWVGSEELPVLEFLARPQPKEGHGVFGGGWERPKDVFAAAKNFTKQLEQQEQYSRGDAECEVETEAQAEARYHAGQQLRWKQFFDVWNQLREWPRAGRE